jgi:hypothetical protein
MSSRRKKKRARSNASAEEIETDSEDESPEKKRKSEPRELYEQRVEYERSRHERKQLQVSKKLAASASAQIADPRNWFSGKVDEATLSRFSEALKSLPKDSESSKTICKVLFALGDCRELCQSNPAHRQALAEVLACACSFLSESNIHMHAFSLSGLMEHEPHTLRSLGLRRDTVELALAKVAMKPASSSSSSSSSSSESESAPVPLAALPAAPLVVPFSMLGPDGRPTASSSSSSSLSMSASPADVTGRLLGAENAPEDFDLFEFKSPFREGSQSQGKEDLVLPETPQGPPLPSMLTPPQDGPYYQATVNGIPLSQPRDTDPDPGALSHRGLSI